MPAGPLADRVALIRQTAARLAPGRMDGGRPNEGAVNRRGDWLDGEGRSRRPV
jgi:hypothetical protein